MWNYWRGHVRDSIGSSRFNPAYRPIADFPGDAANLDIVFQNTNLGAFNRYELLPSGSLPITTLNAPFGDVAIGGPNTGPSNNNILIGACRWEPLSPLHLV